MNAFINWLIKLFSKNTPETIFRNNLLSASHKLSSVNPVVTDVKTRYALANATMYMKGMADKNVNYTKEDVEEMFSFINELVANITTSSLGTTSFRDGKVKSTSLSSTIDSLTALLVFYMDTNFKTGQKILSKSAAQKYLTGIMNRSHNEALQPEKTDSEQQLADLQAEYTTKGNRLADILKKISSGTLTDAETEVLEGEYKQLKVEKNGLEGIIAKVQKTIKSIIEQMLDNREYEALLHEVDKMKSVLSHRAYGSIEELQRAAEEYIEIVTESDAEHEAARTIISMTTDTAADNDTDDELAAARKAGAANKKANENKKVDDENFAADLNANNDN